MLLSDTRLIYFLFFVSLVHHGTRELVVNATPDDIQYQYRLPQISSEDVPGVGDVETVDVPLTKANMKLFRVLLEERAGCAYAVTDAPMVQLEISGERQVTCGWRAICEWLACNTLSE